MLIGKETKSLALAVLELCLSEGISKSVSQSVRQKYLKILKFYNYLMEIDLKTFFGLAMPNQYSQTVKKNQAGFGVIDWDQNPLTFMIPIYSTTVLHDTCTLKSFDLHCSSLCLEVMKEARGQRPVTVHNLIEVAGSYYHGVKLYSKHNAINISTFLHRLT